MMKIVNNYDEIIEHKVICTIEIGSSSRLVEYFAVVCYNSGE